MIILKSKREIAKLRNSGRLVAEVLDRLMQMAGPGIKTIELDREAEKMIKALGAKAAFKGYREYPGSICTSVNEEIVHGIPGHRKLVSGDILSIDVGIIYDGFVGDMAGTVAIGDVDEEKQRLMQVTARALEDAIAQALPDNRLSDISYAVESRVVAEGFSVVRDFVGHGIGASLHEEPQVPNFGKPHRGPKLVPGMVLAIEPMVNAGTYRMRVLEDKWTAVTEDGRPSAHFEHMVAITKDGNEVLTCPKKNR